MFVKVKRFFGGYSIKELEEGLFEFTGVGQLVEGQHLDLAGTLYRVQKISIYYKVEHITSCLLEKVTKPKEVGFWKWVKLLNWS